MLPILLSLTRKGFYFISSAPDLWIRYSRTILVYYLFIIMILCLVCGEQSKYELSFWSLLMIVDVPDSTITPVVINMPPCHHPVLQLGLSTKRRPFTIMIVDAPGMSFSFLCVTNILVYFH